MAMADEKFMVTTSIPYYVFEEMEEKRQKAGLNRSAYIENLIEKNIKKIEELLKNKRTRDITINLSIETIEKIKQLEEKYDTSFGRIIYLSILLDICKFKGGEENV